jgi:hypothetical protein
MIEKSAHDRYHFPELTISEAVRAAAALVIASLVAVGLHASNRLKHPTRPSYTVVPPLQASTPRPPASKPETPSEFPPAA